MESSLKLKLPEELALAIQNGFVDKNELLSEAIAAASDQIGYMLQAYYSREKISRVAVVPGTISFDGAEATLKLAYIREEYNACAAINSEDRDKMTVKAVFDLEAAEFSLTGENWPG